MLKTKQARVRRATKVRANIRRLGKLRLCVHRTPRHIYAQVTTADGAQVVAAASTVETGAVAEGYTGNVSAAERIGALVAQRALEKGVKEVAFDRSGYLYHGRIKALADAARKAGLVF